MNLRSLKQLVVEQNLSRKLFNQIALTHNLDASAIISKNEVDYLLLKGGSKHRVSPVMDEPLLKVGTDVSLTINDKLRVIQKHEDNTYDLVLANNSKMRLLRVPGKYLKRFLTKSPAYVKFLGKNVSKFLKGKTRKFNIGKLKGQHQIFRRMIHDKKPDKQLASKTNPKIAIKIPDPESPLKKKVKI